MRRDCRGASNFDQDRERRALLVGPGTPYRRQEKGGLPFFVEHLGRAGVAFVVSWSGREQTRREVAHALDVVHGGAMRQGPAEPFRESRRRASGIDRSCREAGIGTRANWTAGAERSEVGVQALGPARPPRMSRPSSRRCAACV